ncbi:PhzF family phenazine biosynthesis isomerase [Clostridium sp. HMP27]|uniref:PhzF family phenazine biosynthesis protein n=1 Tax=Clostridium sp. HMP27 TaxID=1487921 RepID=UPI00052D337A|nr:PhzF family phenazine biosynthesis isomerase [Clostridium sp. HMP27]KGK87497.1 hypothetical protein DP68_09350 [Clostridium sp. HMP27]
MIKVFLVKSFTSSENGGNPAGVVINNGLKDEEMQSIAKEVGFSETTFISKIDCKNFELKYFTPEVETNLCGHGTIAAFHCMQVLNEVEESEVYMHTKAGKLKVFINNSKIYMEQSKPFMNDICIEESIIFEALNIPYENKEENLPIKVVSVGTPKIIIPLKNRDMLFDIKPDFEKLKEISRITNSKGFYPFTFDVLDKNNLIHARQFNPLFGIPEDPITGVAAGALGIYLSKFYDEEIEVFSVEQGYILDKPGIVDVKIEEGISYIGGSAVLYDEKHIEI